MGKKGVTLTELIITITIMGIISVPLSLLFFSGYKNYYKEQDTVESQRRARETVNGIIDDLRMYSNQNTKVLVLGNSGYEPDICTLYIKNDISYEYDKGDKILYKNVLGSRSVVLGADEIIDVSFARDLHNPSIINIMLSVKHGQGDEVKLNHSFANKLTV